MASAINVGRGLQTDPTLLRYASAITKQKKCWDLLAHKFVGQQVCVRLNAEQGMAQWWERSPPTSVARLKSRRRCHNVSWVCSERFFSGYSAFPLSSKPSISKFQFHQDQVEQEPLCRCATSKSLFIYFIEVFIYLTFRGPVLSVVANLFCFQYSYTTLYTQLLYFSRLFGYHHAVENAKTGQY